MEEITELSASDRADWSGNQKQNGRRRGQSRQRRRTVSEFEIDTGESGEVGGDGNGRGWCW